MERNMSVLRISGWVTLWPSFQWSGIVTLTESRMQQRGSYKPWGKWSWMRPLAVGAKNRCDSRRDQRQSLNTDPLTALPDDCKRGWVIGRIGAAAVSVSKPPNTGSKIKQLSRFTSYDPYTTYLFVSFVLQCFDLGGECFRNLIHIYMSWRWCNVQIFVKLLHLCWLQILKICIKMDTLFGGGNKNMRTQI